MTKERLFTTLLTVLLVLCAITTSAQDEIIEHQGNRYIIHIENMNPDSEMTLLDVLHICPEFISTDGKDITADYLLSVDDILLSVDYKPLLENIKACDLSQVIVCSYGAVNNAMEGTTGSIDLQFKEGKGLDGKLALNGSTYGNGRVYADISSTGENVTVRGFAQTSLYYGKTSALEDTKAVSRGLTENAMVFVNWNLSERDQMKFKLMQGFNDHKNRITFPEESTTWPAYERWGELSAVYERTLNDKGATLYLEAGMNYANNTEDFYKIRSAIPTWTTEFNIPLSKDLSLMAGWEIGYENLWMAGSRREQYLYNDLYAQFDFTHGPWILTLGDRFRFNNYWNKLTGTDDHSTWSHHRNDHALHASIGYKHREHFIQGTFSRSFINPLISNFLYEIVGDLPVYHTDYKTNLAWRAEARYNYQNSHLTATGSLIHTWLTDMITPNQYQTGLMASVTWNKGPMRLTVGADFFHRHISSSDLLEAVNNNFYHLKLAPTWVMGKGFRLSGVLLYSSRQKFYYELHPYLYASIKVNKDLGKHFNLFADFHDIAGQQTGLIDDLLGNYKNRALTIGLTYYPFRK